MNTDPSSIIVLQHTIEDVRARFGNPNMHSEYNCGQWYIACPVDEHTYPGDSLTIGEGSPTEQEAIDAAMKVEPTRYHLWGSWGVTKDQWESRVGRRS